MRYRILENGNIVFPNKGEPPTDKIAGYEQDPSDPYVYIPIFEECSLRKTVTLVRPCGKLRIANLCTALDREVTPNFCDECPVSK